MPYAIHYKNVNNSEKLKVQIFNFIVYTRIPIYQAPTHIHVRLNQLCKKKQSVILSFFLSFFQGSRHTKQEKNGPETTT